MMRSLKIFVFLVFVFAGLISCATHQEVGVSKISDGVEIYRAEGIKKITLGIDVADWVVSCGKKVAVVWGQSTKEMPVGQPPYAEVYVVDLKKGTALKSFTTTRGPYEVYIDSNEREALIDEYLVDLRTGRVLSTETPPGYAFPKENCPSPEGIGSGTKD